MKKIKSDIESAFSDFTAKLEGNDPMSFDPISSFEELLKNTQMDIPDWSLIGDIALFDQSIEHPEGMFPTDMFVLRIPTDTPEEGKDGEVREPPLVGPPLFEVKSEQNEVRNVVRKETEIIPDEVDDIHVQPLHSHYKTEPTDNYEENDEELMAPPKRVRNQSNSSSRWPKLAISAADEEVWMKALHEASTNFFKNTGKSQSLSYSPMSPDFSEKGESPEHGLNYDDAEQLKARNEQLVTPPDTPPQSLYGEHLDDDIEYLARQAMLSQIETEPDAEKIIRPVKRPSRVAIESFDIPFSFKRKRRHHSRDNCIKRGVLLNHASKCTSCQIYCEVKQIANVSIIRSIQKLDSSQFLIILNREDDRNKFIKAIKKEKRKGGWRATTVDNSIYQENWRKFSNEN